MRHVISRESSQPSFPNTMPTAESDAGELKQDGKRGSSGGAIGGHKGAAIEDTMGQVCPLPVVLSV